MKSHLLFMALLMGTLPAMSQPAAIGERATKVPAVAAANISQLFNSNIPATLQIKDVASGWKIVRVNALSKTSKPQIPVQLDFNEMVAALPDVYFTQWQTLTSGTDTFLVAYRVVPIDPKSAEGKSLSAAFDKSMTRDEELATIRKQMEERPLSLVLLNLRHAENFSDVRPYSLDTQLELLKVQLEKADQAQAERKQRQEKLEQYQVQGFRILSGAFDDGRIRIRAGEGRSFAGQRFVARRFIAPCANSSTGQFTAQMRQRYKLAASHSSSILYSVIKTSGTFLHRRTWLCSIKQERQTMVCGPSSFLMVRRND
jgi:hypothetical protein